ncbi:hypothetical protein [Longimicrobium sp.]|uniref:hypothetical protein n=1 Tax=Longimicrobium sp. TaxID=2029185 RepID=UPI002BC7A086|nr:hypothetical protein [Longimicrobium sp.]HSU12745.1 hypothetical protein [Longimicrobium sp.]
MTKRLALGTLVLAALAILAAYASAFLPGGAPKWAPWPMALGMPAALVAIMVLGAARNGRVGKLALPFAFSGLVLATGFALALALPADERAASPLYGGLPLRAAIVIYGIGILPIVVLPIAYALTFSEQTLNADDLERVRRAGEEWARAKASPSPAPDAKPRLHDTLRDEPVPAIPAVRG